MLTGLQNEINNHSDLITASKEIVMQKLNADGSALVEAWAVIDFFETPIRLSKNTVKSTFLNMEQRKILREMVASADAPEASDEIKDFADLYIGDDVFFVNHPMFRSLVDMLAGPLSLSDYAVVELKRLGERKISRAEELFGRKITAEDFE